MYRLFSGQYAPPPGQYPPQPPGYVPGQAPVQPPPQQIVIVQGAINYGKHPMTMTCPHCQSQIQTSIRSEPGPMGKQPYLIFNIYYKICKTEIHGYYSCHLSLNLVLLFFSLDSRRNPVFLWVSNEIRNWYIVLKKVLKIY